MNGQVNLAAGWNTLWGAISSVIGGQITLILTIIGVVMVIAAVGTWIFQRRRGGGVTQGLGAILWTLIAGALLAAPQVVIPLILTILDLVINGLIAIFQATQG